MKDFFLLSSWSDMWGFGHSYVCRIFSRNTSYIHLVCLRYHCIAMLRQTPPTLDSCLQPESNTLRSKFICIFSEPWGRSIHSNINRLRIRVCIERGTGTSSIPGSTQCNRTRAWCHELFNGLKETVKVTAIVFLHCFKHMVDAGTTCSVQNELVRHMMQHHGQTIRTMWQKRTVKGYEILALIS